ncbi:glycosyltransferase [bacterium]|nr:glycosyltransferase [bacterium]
MPQRVSWEATTIRKGIPANMTSGESGPLELTMISRRFPPQIGGAEKVMRNFSDAFATMGHRVTVLTSADPAEGIRPTVDHSHATEAVNPAVVRLPYNGIRFVGTALYMRSLRRWLRRNPPQVVYVSMLKHDAYVATRWCKAAGVPIVLRPEGAGPTGDMAWQSRDRFGAKIREATQNADGFVALSERIRDDLIDSGYDSNRIHLIPNGVPIPEREWKPAGNEITPEVVFVGRLAFEKGIDRLLAAWPLVLRDVPGARLNLIGEGVELASLKSQVSTLGISGSVRFSGARQDVQEILAHSGVFVLPSREEGLSIALLEAMALGIPVVVSDIPGNATLVQPDATGQIVDADSPRDLAGAIVAALKQSPRILNLAQTGRSLVADRFSIRSAADRHIALFRDLIKRKPTI